MSYLEDIAGALKKWGPQSTIPGTGIPNPIAPLTYPFQGMKYSQGAQDALFGGIKKGAKGAKEAFVDPNAKRVSGEDLLAPYMDPGWLRKGAGFGLEMLADPTNLMSGGTGGIAKALAGKGAMLVKGIAKKGLMELAQEAGPAISKALGGSGIAPALMAFKGKIHPKAHMFRAMTGESLESLLKNREAGLPYEASGTVVSPKVMNTFTNKNPMGLMFDVPDESVIKALWPRDVQTKFKYTPEGGKVYAKNVPTGQKRDLGDILKEQLSMGKGRGWNEAVFDASRADIAGVGLPTKRPEGIYAEDYDRLMDYARKQKLPIYMMGEGGMKKRLPEQELSDPTSGMWERFSTKKLPGIPIFQSSHRSYY